MLLSGLASELATANEENIPDDPKIETPLTYITRMPADYDLVFLQIIGRELQDNKSHVDFSECSICAISDAFAKILGWF